MINEIGRILVKFRPCFSRKAAFNWFVIVGFIVRLDHYGVNSFVRRLRPIHFNVFRLDLIG